MRFNDKVAIVTGAASGIGAAVAERLIAEGAHVMVVDRDAVAGRETTGKLGERATFFEADVSRAAEVRSAVETAVAELGQIDVLVNNAATVNSSPFLDLTEADLDHVMAVNFKSQVLFGQMVGRHLVDTDRRGAIVNMSSMNARLGVPSQAAYASSKGAVESLTRVMAVALAESNVRVNGVGPGTIATPMMRQFVEQTPGLLSTALSRIPLRRLGTPAEVAAVVCFLASEDASYLTGQILYPDGGRLALNYTVPVEE